MRALPGVAALSLVVPTAVWTQEPIVTDRPDQTESAQVVPDGFFQLEAGWTLDRVTNGTVRLQTHTMPGLLVRIGLTSRLEGRLGFAGWQVTGAPGNTIRGDAEVGFKYQVRTATDSDPRMALLGAVSLPTGSGAASSNRADPSVLLALAHQVSDRFTLSYNVGARAATSSIQTGDKTIVGVTGSVSLGIDIAPTVGAFVETFGSLAASATGGNAGALDGGVAFLFGENLQLDASGGIGVGEAAEWFVGSGVSLRLPR